MSAINDLGDIDSLWMASDATPVVEIKPSSSNDQEEGVWLTWKQWLEHESIKREQAERKARRRKPLDDYQIEMRMADAENHWNESKGFLAGGLTTLVI